MKLFNLLSVSIYSTQLISGYKVVVVGSGPAGKLSAISLAKHGLQVSLFEKEIQPKGGRSFNFILSKRAINALEKFDINLDDGVSVKNIVNHIGYEKVFLVKPPKYISIDRNDLMSSMDEKLETFGISTKISEFKNVDFNNKIAYFSHGSESFDLIIGADGSNSRVRDQLALSYPRDVDISKDIDDRKCKTIHFDNCDLKNIPGYDDSWKDSLHGWKSGNSDLICPPTKENGLTGVYISSNGSFNIKEFGIPMDKIDFQNQREFGQKTVISSHVGFQSCILVGDACHSMLASLGQGVNSAMEDVVILDYCLDRNMDLLCENYDRLRLRDAKSVCTLSKKKFATESSRIMQYLGDPMLSYSEILKFIDD